MKSDTTPDPERYITVEPLVVEGEPEACTIRLKVGVQEFTINDYMENAERADFMKRMLAKAIRRIQQEAGAA